MSVTHVYVQTGKKNQILTAVTLVARNANESMVAPVVGSARVWRESACVVHLAGILLQSH
jgi:hypothetical protein